MSLSNPNKIVTEERLNEYHQTILPYLGGMPEILANKFDKGNLYSTDEKMIGQWIDGKPLYQKTVDCGALPNNSVKNFAHSISNLESITDMKGIGISSSQVIPIQWSVDYDSAYGVTLYCDSTNIVFVTKRDQTSYHAYITLQYTKTTDSAISIGNDTDYSTTEKIVGTWIDGKPLYQKTYHLTTVAGNQTLNISDLHVDKIILKDCCIIVASGVIVPGVYYENSNDYFRIFSNTTKDVLNIRTGTNGSFGDTYITLQYTKTAD